MRAFRTAPTAFAAAILMAGIWAACAEPVKIRASWVVAPSDWAPLLPEKSDLMKSNGKSYAYEAVRFQGTPAVITALANNETEVGNLAFSSLPVAIQNAGLEDLRIVSDQFMDGVGSHYSNQFLVLADSPIRRVEDLKGKIVATNTIGSGVDVAMRVMLRKHGLEDKRDYTVVEAPFPTMKAMLVQKKADLATFVAPFAFDPELKQIARPLFAQRDALGPTQMLVWVARSSFCRRTAPPWWISWKTLSGLCAGILTPRTTTKPCKFPPSSRNSVRSCSRPGFSPTRNIPAIPIYCRIFRHCSPTSMRSAISASSKSRWTCRGTRT